MMFQSKILAMRAWRAGLGLKNEEMWADFAPALPTAAKAAASARVGATCALWFAMVLIHGILVLVTP